MSLQKTFSNQRFIYLITWIITFFFNTANALEDTQICVLIGYPGAGKGTAAQSIDTSIYKQLSFGDVLRNELKNQTALALEYKDEIEMNKIEKIRFLPENVVRELLDRYITEFRKTANRIILDGYPKTVDQARYLEEYFEFNHIKGIFIFINTDRSLLLKRVLDRRTCENCSKVYNTVSNPPKQLDLCDVCGGKLFIRGSDNEENQMRRIQFYEETSTQMIQHYRDKGLLNEVDGNQSLNEACSQFQKILIRAGFIYE